MIAAARPRFQFELGRQQTTHVSDVRDARPLRWGGDVATASLLEVWIDEAELDALAWHILDKRPKTLLGLAIRARAEKHLCRYLWTVDFERLPPSDQAARVVIECAMLLSSRPCDRGESRTQSKTPPRGIAGRRDSVLGTTRGSSGLQPSRTPAALASSWRVRNRRRTEAERLSAW